jgi:hypothetical protein
VMGTVTVSISRIDAMRVRAMSARVLRQAIANGLALVLMLARRPIGAQIDHTSRGEAHRLAAAIVARKSIGRLVVTSDDVFVLVVTCRAALAAIAYRADSSWMIHRHTSKNRIAERVRLIQSLMSGHKSAGAVQKSCSTIS